MADPADDEDEAVTPDTANPTSGTTSPPVVPGAPPVAPPAGPDFTSMVRPPGDIAAVQGKLSDIQRAKSASDAKIADETTARLEGDRSRMEWAYKASSIMPDELKHDWDAKAKGAEHSTDPVTAFGSLGSAFAMMASSFAGLPMSASLNAGAAAINAIHAGDEKAYQREFESWKANTDLALKRHEIERQAYNDATNLMNSNINAGRTKMELAATKFGDQKTQALLDAGMDKELFSLFEARNKTALDLQKQWDDVQLQHEKVTDLRNDPRYVSGDQAQKAAAIQDWNQRWAANGGQKLRYDLEADAVAKMKRDNPNWTLDDLAAVRKQMADAAEGSGGAKEALTQEKIDDLHADPRYNSSDPAERAAAVEDWSRRWSAKGTGKSSAMNANTPEKAFIADKVKALATAEGREPTAEERLQWKQEWTAAQTKKPTSSGAQKAAAIKDIFDSAEASGKPISLAEATRQYNLTAATPTGNRIDDINKQINQFDNGKQAIDRVLASIDRHWGSVGVAGYATRGAERVGNIFGSNETDRSQVAHDIQYLQTIAPRLMNDASARGLKAEADKINSIIAGLNLGDTTANTKRALGEVKDLWDKMQQDNLARRNGTPNLPPPTGGTGNTGGTGGSSGSSGATKPRWQNAPIVSPGPRSEAESDAAYG